MLRHASSSATPLTHIVAAAVAKHSVESWPCQLLRCCLSATQVKVTELVEGLQLVQAGFFTEVIFA